MSTQEPREIAFEDICKGDDIESRSTANGTAFTRRGIAHAFTGNTWITEEGGTVASGYRGDAWAHYLHPRPVPAEPKGLGAVVRARARESGEIGLFVRTPSLPTLPGVPTREPDWVDCGGHCHYWSDFDPATIEILHDGMPEGEGVES